MPINKTWHRQHKMPKNPSFEQRRQWHQAHQANCSGWPLPKGLLLEIKKRKIKI